MNAREKLKLVNLVQVPAPEIKIDKKCSMCKKSICCNSINQQIDAPRSFEDFDHLLWQVSHDNVNIFKDADGWFLHIHSRCQHLLEGGVCAIYETRPFVCRAYTNDHCEFDTPIPEAADMFFTNHREFEKYCRKRFKNWDKRFELRGYND